METSTYHRSNQSLVWFSGENTNIVERDIYGYGAFLPRILSNCLAFGVSMCGISPRGAKATINSSRDLTHAFNRPSLLLGYASSNINSRLSMSVLNCTHLPRCQQPRPFLANSDLFSEIKMPGGHKDRYRVTAMISSLHSESERACGREGQWEHQPPEVCATSTKSVPGTPELAQDSPVLPALFSKTDLEANNQ